MFRSDNEDRTKNERRLALAPFENHRARCHLGCLQPINPPSRRTCNTSPQAIFWALKWLHIYRHTQLSRHEVASDLLARDWHWPLIASADVHSGFTFMRSGCSFEHLFVELARVDVGVHGAHYEYELTPMGKDFATLMTGRPARG